MRVEYSDGTVGDCDTAAFRDPSTSAAAPPASSVPIAPTKYKVLARSTVRTGPDPSSAKVGHHVKGTIIDVVQESTNSDGLVVFQTITAPAGWVKMVTSKGKFLMERLGAEQQSLEQAERVRLETVCPECEHGGKGELCHMHDQQRLQKLANMAGGFNRRMSLAPPPEQQQLLLGFHQPVHRCR